MTSTTSMRLLVPGGGAGGHIYLVVITIRALQARLAARRGRPDAAEQVVTALLPAVRRELVQVR